MKKYTIAVLSVIFILSLVTAVSASTSAPRIHIKAGASLNWAGYAIETNLITPQKGAVSSVSGSWIVPAVDCSATPNAYATFWVGIDGYASGTVEQIGTDSDCSGTTPSYYAWFEMYPKFPVYINRAVSPGDHISAEVTYVGKGLFQLTINDESKGWTFTTTQKSPSAKRSSAEWIAEAPWSGGVLPLANFGTVTFTDAQATVNGHTGTISDTQWQYDRIDMVTPSGALKAQTSGLKHQGDTFTVTWVQP